MIKKKDVKAANRAIKATNDFRLAAKHYLIGVIALGDHAPKEWILMVNKLLFANERPYFPMDIDEKLEAG